MKVTFHIARDCQGIAGIQLIHCSRNFETAQVVDDWKYLDVLKNQIKIRFVEEYKAGNDISL
jgi:hypothetical protein